MDYLVWLIIFVVIGFVGYAIFKLGQASAQREEHERNYYPLPEDSEEF